MMIEYGIKEQSGKESWKIPANASHQGPQPSSQHLASPPKQTLFCCYQ